MARNDHNDGNNADNADNAGNGDIRRVWPRNAALALLAAGAAFLVLKFTGAAPEDDSTPTTAPATPAGSGLRTLPPTSGMVQSFAGTGRAMIVTLGQWSDGRTGDFQKLVDRLGPLQKAVSGATTAYETAN
ncbi:hypothetical protein [Streptomyces sp. NPDC004267]|uniref:hypothetical protein n=1 Tax=Streptomyces sp. NPDC004267 TaxID=3364694 RepID=UPI00367B8757